MKSSTFQTLELIIILENENFTWKDVLSIVSEQMTTDQSLKFEDRHSLALTLTKPHSSQKVFLKCSFQGYPATEANS